MQLEHIEVFPWNKNFETGIEQIDDQHKKLVALLNKLANTLVREDQLEVIKVFDELAEYAAYHFETEETIWSEYFANDSWLESHILSHSSFLPKVMTIKERDEGKPVHDVIEDILRFLIRWLAFHIIDDDKKMSLVVMGLTKGLDLDAAKLQADKKMSGSIRVLIDTVLSMYDGLSSRTLDLMRERVKRKSVEQQLKKANKTLEKLSITDQLTGLYNRRHFDDVFRKELRRARRESTYVSLISLDIDYFKNLNDQYGHAKGDDALRQVGQTILESCRRSGDFVFRVGGEEFLVLSVNLPLDEALDFAENIKSAIAALEIPNVGSKISDFLTVSAGVSTKIPSEGDSVDSILVDVDKHLYQAKREGRNRVVGRC